MVSEFVISGGEPIMDLDILKTIVNACQKPVYINTSLPRVKNIYDVIKFIKTFRMTGDEKIDFLYQFRGNMKVIEHLLYYQYGYY